MELCISRRQYVQILKWAYDSVELECCGLLLGQGAYVHKLILADNIASQPDTHFEIDPSNLIAAEKDMRSGGLSVLGYFHSHPNGAAQPSDTDAKMATADGRLWLIIAAETITAWQATNDGVLHGRFNPVTLVIDDDAQG